MNGGGSGKHAKSFDCYGDGNAKTSKKMGRIMNLVPAIPTNSSKGSGDAGKGAKSFRPSRMPWCVAFCGENRVAVLCERKFEHGR